MRIRYWNAFGSNNSGSYTIVGSFRERGRAQAVAELLRPVLAEHSQWLANKRIWTRSEAPLHRFVRERGLPMEKNMGLRGDWPQFGPPPQAVAVNDQVLVHCEYTISMPRFIGELICMEGGHVEIELDHADHDTMVMFNIWFPWALAWDQPEAAQARLVKLLEDLRAGPLGSHTDWGAPPAWGPAPPGNGMRICAVFEDLVEGVNAVRSIVATAPASLHLRVFEAPAEPGDPLAFLHDARPTIPGHYQVILWRAGPDRASTLAAIDAVKGAGPGAVELLDAPPVVILSTINLHDARAAMNRLTKASAEAELVTPNEQRAR